MPEATDSDVLSRTGSAPRYDSLLVHVQPGLTTSHRVEIAAGLAKRFGARLIGIGAEQVEPIAFADPYSGQLIGEMYEQLRKQLAADLDSAEAAFRRDAAGVESEWRRVEATPRGAVTHAARAADLIVMGGDEAGSPNAFTTADAGDIILESGRPVLIAPAGAAHLKARSILVAWKDTREARRAVADALPFLVGAEEVVVQAVCAKDAADAMKAATEDVAAALRRRGAPARANVTTAPDSTVADELSADAALLGADLIVAGAYGHSRMAEWVLGGVTRELLRDPQRYLLLSH